MFDIELVDGKDHLGGVSTDKYDKIVKTVGLLVRLCHRIYSTNKDLIFDSGFCVFQWIIELRKLGGLQVLFIKNRFYWPPLVLSDAINDHFYTK